VQGVRQRSGTDICKESKSMQTTENQGLEKWLGGGRGPHPLNFRAPRPLAMALLAWCGLLVR
jgi:hypothetical protein